MADVKISDLSDVSATGDLDVADILPIVDTSAGATTSVTLDILKDFFRNHIDRAGWEYVSDKALETTAITATEDTWTVLTNDGTSSATSREFLPYGTSSIFDTSDNKIKCSGLQTRDVTKVKEIPNLTKTFQSVEVSILIGQVDDTEHIRLPILSTILRGLKSFVNRLGVEVLIVH